MRLYTKSKNQEGVKKSFNETMVYIQDEYINKYKLTDGNGKIISSVKSFFYDILELFDELQTECEQMVIDPYSSEDYLHISFKNKTTFKNIAHYCFGVDKKKKCFYLKTYDIFDENIFSELEHSTLLDEMIQIPTEINGYSISEPMEVQIYHHKDGNKTIEKLEGTLPSIFNTFIDMNNFLRYINSEKYSFKDPQITKAYYEYIDSFKGNIFLERAVKRGVTID